MPYYFFRALLLLLIVAGLSLAHPTGTVSACTFGPGPTLEEQLQSSSIIVRGQIVETDTARQNYILQVDEYLVGGSGPEFILLDHQSPHLIQALLDTNAGGGDCVWFNRPRPEFESSYFWLNGPSIFGTYHGNINFGYAFPVFAFPLTIYNEETDDRIRLNQSEFEEWIFELRGDETTPPLEDSRYPATAPLLITDADGNEYILPVDSTDPIPLEDDSSWLYIPEFLRNYEPVGCASWDCVTLSLDDRTFFVRIGDEYWYRQNYTNFYFSADHFVLSPISMAVWNDDHLQVYALHDTLRFFSDSVDMPLPRLVNEIEVDSSTPIGVWSEDGNLLAFSDSEGLWLWNPFLPDSAPRLLVPTDEYVPTPLHFSGYGRYLAIEHGDTRYIFDLITQSTLPFGYISPDGQLMISCHPVSLDDLEHEDACDLVVQQLAPYSDRPREVGIVDSDVRIEWVTSRRIMIYGCNLIEDVCGVFDIDPYAVDWDTSFNTYQLYPRSNFIPAITFAAEGRNIAILTDESTIIVNGDTLELDLNSPIVAIRWLPTFFFGEEARIPLRRPVHRESQRNTMAFNR